MRVREPERDSELVVIATFASEAEALPLAAVLEGTGIRYLLERHGVGSTLAFPSTTTPVVLKVLDHDVDAARAAIVAAVEGALTPAATDDASPQPKEARSFETVHLARSIAWALRATGLVAAVVILAAPLVDWIRWSLLAAMALVVALLENAVLGVACPACGERFFKRRWARNRLVRRCRHCDADSGQARV